LRLSLNPGWEAGALAEEKKAEEKKPDGSGGDAAAKAAESPWSDLLKNAVKQALGVLLTGAGLLGFVAFAGAVIVWSRFEAIEVPSDQAVKAVPREELVASGASLLLIFGFFGVLAVLATYLVDRGGRATPGMSRVLLALVALEGIATIILAGELSMLSVGMGLGFLLLVGLALLVTFHEIFARYVDELTPRDGETEDPLRGSNSIYDVDGRLRFSLLYPLWIMGLLTAAGFLFATQVLDEQVTYRWIVIGLLCVLALIFAGVARIEVKVSRKDDEWAEKRANAKAEEEAKCKQRRERATTRGRIVWLAHEARREWKWLGGVLREPEPTEAKAAADARRVGKRRPHRLELNPFGVCLLLWFALLAIVLPAALLHHWWVAVSFGAAFVLAAGVWRVAVLSAPSFFWFGLVVFVSVPLFGTLTLMARNVEDPQVQPLAMIRSTDGPGESIQGIYVTEANNRVYFANVATEGCTDDVVTGSGRLLWVPREEVVAMSIGPLQDVKKAGQSALEMAYALTPGVETPTGLLVSLGDEGTEEPPSEDRPTPDGDGSSGDDKATSSDDGETGSAGDSDGGDNDKAGQEEEEDPTDEHRLEGAGPAVRPSLGRGLKLVPSAAEPGDVVELRMSSPENGGFGVRPRGYNLRLGGVRLAVLRGPANRSDQAEYVKTAESGAVLPIDWHTEKSATEGTLIRLERDSIAKVIDGKDGRYALEVEPNGRLARVWDAELQKAVRPRVELPNGQVEPLRLGLLRRTWSEDKIKFRVPEGAETGAITVECGQLAGQPVLTVVQPPIARVAVRMEPGSARVTFDSSRSGVEGEGELTRVWTVAGREMGDRAVVSTMLPERLGPYEVSLTVSDSSGLSDTVELQVLRLPASRFPLGETEPARPEDLERVRDALDKALGEGGPEAIELGGHADAVGDERFNAALSLRRVERLRELLFPFEPRAETGGEKIPLVMHAFGESCPIVYSPGPEELNRRVEVFLLGPGAIVAPRNGCRVARIKRVNW
jgi:outer membrane protein OmpA-like peptidoglycan-associated protein